MVRGLGTEALSPLLSVLVHHLLGIQGAQQTDKALADFDKRLRGHAAP